MLHIRRPSLHDRALSTPPITPSSTSTVNEPNQKMDLDDVGSRRLTPPTSPRQSRSSSDIQAVIDADCQQSESPLHSRTRGGLLDRLQTKTNDIKRSTQENPLQCPFDVEILKDEKGRSQVFGTGAWSTVYKATVIQRPAQMIGLSTPPVSPVAPHPQIVAIKKPARRDATTILQNEAKILNHLMSVSGNEERVISFYGCVDEDSTLVLDAVSLSLENYIKTCAVAANENTTTNNMHNPVIGSTRIWLDLAYQLVSGLSWLHNEAEVVHGDIKPGNILLQPGTKNGSQFPFTTVFIDFSSSQLLTANEPTPNTLSAITREYTAPELLNSAVLRDPKSTATTDSDVFSMAVTLLVAATGETIVYPGSLFQRQVMATQGWYIISNVRNGPQGLRIPRQGVVERCIERAVLKAGMGRISADHWVDLIQQQSKPGPSKV